MSNPFAGSHTTLHDYFGGAENLVVPEYQREFSWTAENANQLMRDVEVGISKLDKRLPVTARQEDSSKFLGCVIQWQRGSIANDDYVPSGTAYINHVRELIDGQQRISTITLLFCELFYKLESVAARLDQSISTESQFATFLKTVRNQWLLPRFSRSGSSGAVPKRRPTIIRQGSDRWTHSGQTEYNSPLAAYVLGVITGINTTTPSVRPAVVGKEISPVVKAIAERIEEQMLAAPDVLASNYDQMELLEEFFTESPDIDIQTYLATSPANSSHIKAGITLVAWAHYLLNYCAFTVITSPNQDTALDMFQSLNATGVQLTAVQLLKPRVSSTFRNGGSSFKGDVSFQKFEAVNSWLNGGSKSSSKTAQFFLKFGIGIFGKEPVNSLSGQRSWLLQHYDEFTNGGVDIDKARELIRLMGHYVTYLDRFYFQSRESLFAATNSPTPGSRRTFDQFKLEHHATSTSFNISEAAVTALMFLIDAKHDFAHSFLALFFVKFQEAPASNVFVARQEFEKVTLAVAACFVLWRGSFLEKYPDAAYRAVLEQLCYTVAPQAKARTLGRALIAQIRLKRRPNRSLVSNNTLFKSFAAGLQYRSGAQQILRFVLILAAHRRVQVDSTDSRFIEYGIVTADMAGPDYFYPDVWVGTEYSSLEHIAPQKLVGYTGTPVPHWPPTFAIASDALNSIGNLTLLSLQLNASVPEDTPSKQNHYEGLVSPGASPGVTPNAAALMSSSPMLQHLIPPYLRLTHWLVEISSGSPITNSWDEAFVARRASNIAAMAGAHLIKWLRA